jgi:hypothetical protein
MGGRLFPQRARRPFVPNKGDEARQCRKKEPRTVLGRGLSFPHPRGQGIGKKESIPRSVGREATLIVAEQKGEVILSSSAVHSSGR